VAGAPLTGFQTDKMRALLVYLALEREPHSRSELTRFLWPGYQAESAANSFRQYLHQLRQLLRNDEWDPPWLLVTRQTVQFNPAARLEADVTRFLALVTESSTHAHTQLSLCQPCLARLREAVGLYGGDFLAGFTVADSDPFEEWRRIQQEQLHLHALNALTQLADAAEAAGQSEQALQDSQRQLALEPWLEAAHRRIMRILARRGQRTAALAQFQLCSQVLASELGAAPEAETLALSQQIQSGALDKEALPQARGGQGHQVVEAKSPGAAPTEDPTPPPLHDWGEMPAVEQIQGRSVELTQLAGWLDGQEGGVPKPACRLVAVLGMGGTGKSTLVAALIKTVAPMFEVVMWRSLLNAPPPAEVIGQWLQVLTHQTLHTLPDSLTEQVRLLLDQLRRQRCLLVLDNLESILQPDSAGAMRPGYEGYGQLLQQVGGTTHQSVLLLTSREQPQVLTRLLGAKSPVRLLPLAGLDAGAGHALLQTHGLKASAADAHALVTHYSGNPLALQLVAQTVQDLFAGQIAPFLAAGAPIFDDIRSVLDQQYARLSPLEGEILRWLALERRPITLPTLRDNLLQPPPIHRLLEAVRALQRRSLLEIVGEGFTLQNVVMEYVTEQLVEGICAEVAAQSADGGIPQSLFNRHALLNAQSNEFVRVSQARLILQPIAERLLQEMGESGLTERLQQILADLRAQTRGTTVVPGYAAGNILNLLLHLSMADLIVDFSHLAVWCADLRGAYLPNLNFTGADLSGSVFTHSFGRLGSLQFDADNELMFVDIVDNRLRLWQLVDATLRHEYGLADLPVFRVTMSSNCNTLAVLTIEHQLILVDLAAQRQLPPLRAHAHPIWRCEFSPDDHWLISGDTSGLVCLWDCRSGQLVQKVQLSNQAITALAMAPDGETLAAATVTGAIYLWSLNNEGPLQTLQNHTDEVATLSFAANGSLLASGSHDTTVGVWEVESGSLRYRLRGHTQPIRRSLASTTGHTLVTAGTDPFVYVWDLEQGVAKHMLAKHGAGIEQLAFSADSKLVALIDRNTLVSLWDAQQGQRLDAYPIYRNVVLTVDFSPDGATMLSGGGDGAMYLWRINDGQAAHALARIHAHDRRILAVAFSGDERFFASGDDDHLIRLWERGSNRLLATLDGHAGSIAGLAFSPDGQLLASCSYDGTVVVWSLPGGQRLHRLLGHRGIVSRCAFRPVGGAAGQGPPRLLASSGLDHALLLWDADRGELYKQLQGHTNGITQCCFNADGRRLISASYDQTWCVWDVASGQRLTVWPSAQTTYISLALHPADTILAASGEDHIIRILDLETGQLLAELQGHSEFVVALRFHPQGRLLASASGDQTLMLWDVDEAVRRGGRSQPLQTLKPSGPYAGMKIAGVTGINPSQKAALVALGAVEA
jgi:WD40 repeat protein/DNA-binding SARP family transcriptional activator